MALAFLHAATQAPQPMHAAASIAASATSLPMGSAFASCGAPVRTVTKPPACWMRSNALRSTTRSFTTGKALARKGSIQIVSPTSGRKRKPRSLPPPNGAQGRAQPLSSSSPSTAGTLARTRPTPSGSALSVTTASYLP